MLTISRKSSRFNSLRGTSYISHVQRRGTILLYGIYTKNQWKWQGQFDQNKQNSVLLLENSMSSDNRATRIQITSNCNSISAVYGTYDEKHVFVTVAGHS